jgi:glycosyltransferase involved in cell wall biosynthesis
MAAGCPLVLSDIPAHRELLDQRAAHFVGAGDATGAAVAIVDVLEQPGAAAVRAAAARAVAAGFTPARTGDSYELVYQQVLPCVAS